MEHIPFLLQGVEDPLAQEGKSCPAVAHAFNQLQFVDLAFGQTIVLRKREPCHYCGFVLDHSSPRDAQRVKEGRKDGLSCHLKRLCLVDQKRSDETLARCKEAGERY
jgi:hypothetical protein